MHVYHDMITEVLRFGTRKENRTGVDTISTFNHNYELAWGQEMYGLAVSPLQQGHHPGELDGNRHILDPTDGPGLALPLLTTKNIRWKNIIVEMLWFLSGSTDIEILKRHKCKFWDAWADEDGQVPSAYGHFWRQFPVHPDPNRKKPTVEELREILNGKGGTEIITDPATGEIFAKSDRYNDQIAWALNTLRNSPMSRRVVVNAWAPGNAQTSALPPCHFAMCFNVQNVKNHHARCLKCKATFPPESMGCPNCGVHPDITEADYEQRLCLHLTQRSCDLALGVPYNMASYGLLLAIMSHLTGIKPGIFAHTLLDLHIYTAKPDGSMAEYDQIPGLKEQAERPVRQLPRLIIDPAIKELSDIEALMGPEVTTQQILDAFKLDGYDPHPAIPFKVAV